MLVFSADERLEPRNQANGKEISDVPFGTEKVEYLWRYSPLVPNGFFSCKITVPFDFQPKFLDVCTM